MVLDEGLASSGVRALCILEFAPLARCDHPIYLSVTLQAGDNAAGRPEPQKRAALPLLQPASTRSSCGSWRHGSPWPPVRRRLAFGAEGLGFCGHRGGADLCGLRCTPSSALRCAALHCAVLALCCAALHWTVLHWQMAGERRAQSCSQSCYHLKPIGCTWPYLACRTGHWVPVRQPCTGSSFHWCCECCSGAAAGGPPEAGQQAPRGTVRPRASPKAHLPLQRGRPRRHAGRLRCSQQQRR
jgi:hypothetical protein